MPVLQRELSVRNDPAAIHRLRRVLVERRPDVLHTHTAKAGATGRIAALTLRRRPRALVHTFHGHVLRGYFDERRSRAFTAAERILAGRTGAVIAVSEEVRDDLVRLGVAPRDRFVVIPYGFDLASLGAGDRVHGRELIGAGEEFVVGWVGRLAPVKRPLDAVRVLRSMLDRGVDASLCMVGDGEEREAVETLARELDVTDRCRLAGYRKELPDWYAGFDALALTSVNEGTPVAAIEALAARRPVAATRVGGVPAVVADGEDGFLVPSGDTDALAARLAELAADPALRERMGARGAERMREHYSVERMVARIEALYDGLLA
jgi:glycosyltransferase involved in cell wall biosynthesis